MLLAVAFWGVAAGGRAADLETESPLESPSVSLWDSQIGEGFRKGANELSFSLGGGYGLTVFGTREHHDWVLGFVEYGRVLSEVVAKDQWYRGNWELIGDVFGGFQFSPDHAYVAGAAPLLRYNIATGTRWVPFVEAGAGVTSTDIRDGDLSTKFEFNLQAGLGVHYFLKDNWSLTMQWRLIHLSNAGLSSPNLGVNSSTLMLGSSWLF